MKHKKILTAVLCVLCLAVVIGAVCIGVEIAPRVDHALRISELLQPVLNAPNQGMHIALSAQINGKPVEMESNIFLVTEAEAEYLVLEQNGNALFVSGNVLFLENGKAFAIGEGVQPQLNSGGKLLPQIGALYDALQITAEEAENSITYGITVTGEQVKSLLAAASLGADIPVEGIRKLELRLTEKNGELQQICLCGNGAAEDITVMVEVTLSGFRILAAGDYPVPEEVKQSAAAVDPGELFSLTEDLYRLILALAPLAQEESLDGTLELTVDCGPIQQNTKLRLSELQSSSGSLDQQKLQALPEMLGWLCMEGDISCTPRGNDYVYTLALDRQSMDELVRMILPELQQYGGSLTGGNVTILLEGGKILSMEAAVEGKISALITQIPISIGVELTFD